MIAVHVCPVCGRQVGEVVDRCGSCADKGYWAQRIFEIQGKQRRAKLARVVDLFEDRLSA